MSNAEFHNEIRGLFIKGMGESFACHSDALTTNIRETSKLEGIEEDEICLLTISSLDFRIFVTIHFSNKEACRRLALEQLGLADGQLDDSRFYDYIGELGNTLCGTMKRDINKFVPSLGMSTPNRLNRECLDYIKTQNPEYEYHSLVKDQYDATLCAASIHICADQALEFDYAKQQFMEEDEVDSGELELF